MAPNGQRAPDGWDEAVPDGAWPETLINAVRRDAAALGTPRAVATIRRWQVCARQGQPEEAEMARRFLEALADALLPSTGTHEPVKSRRSAHITATPGALAQTPAASSRPSTPASPADARASASAYASASDVATPDMPTIDAPAVFGSTPSALTPVGTRSTPSPDFQVPESALARIQAIAASWSPNAEPPAPAPIRSEPALPAFAAVAAIHAKTPTGTSPPPEAAFEDDDLPTRSLPRLVPLPHGAAAEPTLPERRGESGNANARVHADAGAHADARARADVRARADANANANANANGNAIGGASANANARIAPTAHSTPSEDPTRHLAVSGKFRSRLNSAFARARGFSRPEDFDELEEIEDFDALEDVDPDFTEIAMMPRKRAQKRRSESTIESPSERPSERQADRRDEVSRRHTRLASVEASASDNPKSPNRSTQPKPKPKPKPEPKPANARHVWKLKRMTSVGERAATPTNDNHHGQRTAARTNDSVHAPSRAPTEFAEPGADPRPRAARASVLSLHRALRPLVEELIGLPASRRPRRFWGRWREVVGDRGVRRAFVESILSEVNDAYTLACELIAEVHQVQRESVYALVAEIEANNDEQDF
ncbi:MAG: hypothetical protein H6729_14005 [Deltaproteobacteria bacterium]|nr:hypothetical protein [Deltaproteobacteria bacterium]